MPNRSRRRRSPARWSTVGAARSAVLAAALLLAGCGVEVADGAQGFGRTGSPGASSGGDVVGSDIEPSASTTAPPTTVPAPPDVDIIGSDGSEVNDVAAAAIEDLERFWGDLYPTLYGDPYEPVAGGFYAIDASTDPATLPCGVVDVQQVLNNAYYCPPDDAVAWDQEGLMPDLADQYGSFTVAVVLAHEWGHAVQARSGDDQQRTVTLELQADCFAGAWVRHVRGEEDGRFAVDTEQLDLALAGILSLKDAPGSLADDPNAHGSGFDRVGAFQDGYEQSASRCARYQDGDPVPYQFPFSADDRAGTGDLPYTDDGFNEGIDTAAFTSLELYWADAFPGISAGRPWEPLAPARPFSPDDPPDCDGEPVDGFRLFLCVPDRYVGYDDEETLPDAYDFGDFAVGTLFATQYGLAVQEELGSDPPDPITATLRGDCYAGSWAGAILPTDPEDPDFSYRLVLSPGDLDEAVAVLLSFRAAADRDRQGPGFERVRAFRLGVIDGPEACADLVAPD